MSLENNKKSIEKIKRYKKNVSIIIICLIVAVILFKILSENKDQSTAKLNEAITNVIEGEEGKVSTISEMTLNEVFDISELSTAYYTYNAIAKAYEEDGTTVKYYVSYEGKVKAGIDFSEIEFEINDEEKLITIIVPDVEIMETIVDPGTLEYIFKNKKSETETVHQEAFKICEEDLNARIDKEEELLTLADKNTTAIVEALVTPWIKQIDSDYELVIK